MRYELVDLELPIHVVLHEIGELRAAFHAAEGAALPATTGYELESCRGIYESVFAAVVRKW